MSARSKGALAAIIASATCVIACGAIIGTRDLTLIDESDGATTTSDASNATDGTASTDGNVGVGDDANADGNVDANMDASCTSLGFATDPANCGRCGHSCLGGTCAGMVCQPVVVVPNQDGACGVAVDATDIYWVSCTGNFVGKAAKDGSNPTQFVIDYADSPFDIVLDATDVYWANVGGSVAKCPKTGCGQSGTPIETFPGVVTGVALDDTHAYWASYGDLAIGRMLKDGGQRGFLETMLDDHPHMIAVDDASAYFTMDHTVGKMSKNAQTVPSQNQDAAVGFTTVTTSASNSSTLFGIAVDDVNLYWVDNDDPGTIAYTPKGGGAIKKLASAESYPLRVALDATNVYWVAFGPDTSQTSATLFLSGYVATCPKTGCTGSPTKLASNLKNSRGLAVDNEAIYWTVEGNAPGEGAVMKVAKP